MPFRSIEIRVSSSNWDVTVVFGCGHVATLSWPTAVLRGIAARGEFEKLYVSTLNNVFACRLR